MASARPPRTDIGTVLLHWALVAALAVASATGLRIAADDEALAFLRALNAVLPAHNLFFNHLASGLALTGLMGAYAVYILRTGLVKRVRLDRGRLAGAARAGRTRWSAANAVLTWICFLSLPTLAITGAALFLGAGSGMLGVHLWATWVVLAFPLLHIALHYGIGGGAQLARIFLPTAKLPKPAPSLAELFSEHLAEAEAGQQTPAVPPPAPRMPFHIGPAPGATPSLAELAGQRRRTRGLSVHANPLVTALAAGAGLVVAGGAVEQATRVRLVVHRIGAAAAPSLDGDLSDPAWSTAPPVTIVTQHGANLGGHGQSNVEVRALHDGAYAYLAFVWDDPSRSLKHLPLIKSQGGWYRAGDGHERADETTFNDDQFSALFLDAETNIIGAAIHLASGSIDGLPPSTSGRGLHYTPPGLLADVWVWKASRGGLLGNMDNRHFAPPMALTRDHAEGRRHYSGGASADDGEAMAVDNVAADTPFATRGRVQPLRLPKDIVVAQAAMGRIDPHPDHSEPEGSVWWLTPETSEPYAASRDAGIPDGTVIPGVYVGGPAQGARGEIVAAAKWASGRWTLEVRRKLDTGRKQDVAIRTNVRMWVAVFDHAETRHTWHLRPLRLEVK